MQVVIFLHFFLGVGGFSWNQPKHLDRLMHPSGNSTYHLFCSNTGEDITNEHSGSPNSQILFTQETLNILKQTLGEEHNSLSGSFHGILQWLFLFLHLKTTAEREEENTWAPHGARMLLLSCQKIQQQLCHWKTTSTCATCPGSPNEGSSVTSLSNGDLDYFLGND